MHLQISSSREQMVVMTVSYFHLVVQHTASRWPKNDMSWETKVRPSFFRQRDMI